MNISRRFTGWEGECASGCGCLKRLGHGAPDRTQMYWCRRCLAYSLFRWKEIDVTVTQTCPKQGTPEE